MSLMAADFLRRCESLYRASRRVWGERFLARRVERQLAGGTEVTGYSDYTTGDDYRYVDWNRCARLDELLSKQFQGNEDPTTYFLLDCSASMRIREGAKLEAARRLTATLAYMAIAHLDRVGLLAFADRSLAELQPARGRRHLPRLLTFLGQLGTEIPLEHATTDLRKVVEKFVRQPQRRRGLVVIVSDMFDLDGITPALDMLRRYHYEPSLLQMVDQLDVDPATLLQGGVQVQDIESGSFVRERLDTNDLENYRQVFCEFQDSLKNYCHHHHLSFTQITAEASKEQAIQKMLVTHQVKMYS